MCNENHIIAIIVSQRKSCCLTTGRVISHRLDSRPNASEDRIYKSVRHGTLDSTLVVITIMLASLREMLD